MSTTEAPRSTRGRCPSTKNPANHRRRRQHGQGEHSTESEPNIGDAQDVEHEERQAHQCGHRQRKGRRSSVAQDGEDGEEERVVEGQQEEVTPAEIVQPARLLSLAQVPEPSTEEEDRDTRELEGEDDPPQWAGARRKLDDDGFAGDQ